MVPIEVKSRQGIRLSIHQKSFPGLCGVYEENCRSTVHCYQQRVEVMPFDLLDMHLSTWTNMLHCFQSQGNFFQGVVTILSKRLMSLHWEYEGNGVWNFHGARFHVFMSSPKHIEFLVERSWLRHVCERVKHRKYLGQMQSLCRMNLNHLSELSSSQRAMLDFQSCGEQFTNDAKKYFGDVSPSCPFCENGMDSRLHRFEVCSFFQPVRQEFPHLFAKWDAIPLTSEGIFAVAGTTDVRRIPQLVASYSFPYG